MSLVIKNLQRVVPIRRMPLRRKMDLVRSILGVKKFDLGIICVDNKNIQNINRIYRNKNVPTDVLSFPFHEVKKNVLLVWPTFLPEQYLLIILQIWLSLIFEMHWESSLV